MGHERIDFDVFPEIIDVGRRMEEAKLVNTSEGNISIKRDGLVYITPSRHSKRTLTREIIAVIDEAGQQIWGSMKPSSETPMHLAAYGIHPGTNAVIHCHAPYLTAHAICNKSIKLDCHPELLCHLKDIPCAPYGRPGTEDILDKAREALKDRYLVLLGNHGVLAVASSLEKCFARVETAESIARLMTIVAQVGEPVPLPAEELERYSHFQPAL